FSQSASRHPRPAPVLPLSGGGTQWRGLVSFPTGTVCAEAFSDAMALPFPEEGFPFPAGGVLSAHAGRSDVQRRVISAAARLACRVPSRRRGSRRGVL